MTEICRQHRQYDTMSIAAGAQIKIEECGRPATETVAVDGAVHGMCGQCASDAVREYGGIEIRRGQERDAAHLREYATIMAGGAEVWAASPEIASWFAECAAQLEAMAVNILEGRI